MASLPEEWQKNDGVASLSCLDDPSWRISLFTTSLPEMDILFTLTDNKPVLFNTWWEMKHTFVKVKVLWHIYCFPSCLLVHLDTCIFASLPFQNANLNFKKFHEFTHITCHNLWIMYLLHIIYVVYAVLSMEIVI